MVKLCGRFRIGQKAASFHTMRHTTPQSRLCTAARASLPRRGLGLKTVVVATRVCNQALWTASFCDLLCIFSSFPFSQGFLSFACGIPFHDAFRRGARGLLADSAAASASLSLSQWDQGMAQNSSEVWLNPLLQNHPKDEAQRLGLGLSEGWIHPPVVQLNSVDWRMAFAPVQALSQHAYENHVPQWSIVSLRRNLFLGQHGVSRSHTGLQPSLLEQRSTHICLYLLGMVLAWFAYTLAHCDTKFVRFPSAQACWGCHIKAVIGATWHKLRGLCAGKRFAFCLGPGFRYHSWIGAVALEIQGMPHDPWWFFPVFRWPTCNLSQFVFFFDTGQKVLYKTQISTHKQTIYTNV